MKGKPLIDKRKAAVALAACALLALATGGARLAEEHVLRADWGRIEEAARARGVALAGTLPAASVFGRSSLPVADVTAADPTIGVRFRAVRITLDRPLLRLFRLTVSVPEGLDLAPHGAAAPAASWHVWARSLSATRTGRAWRIEGSDLAAAIDGSGPDDVTAIGKFDATASLIPGAAGIGIGARASAILLPLHGTWALGRKVEEGSLSATVTRATLRIDHIDASWSGQYGRLSATLSRAEHTGLAGDGRFTFGPGWASSLRRAGEAGALTEGKARALIGVLGLLEPDESRPVSVNFSVDRNIVTVGAYRLLDLAAADPAGSGSD